MIDLKGLSPLADKTIKLRDKALELCRIKAIHRYFWDRTDLLKMIEEIGKTAKEITKTLAIAEYNLAHLDPTHPEYTEDKEHMEKLLENFKKDMIEVEKNDATTKERLEKELTNLDQKIKDTSEGKILIKRDNIDARFEELLTRQS